MSTPNPIFTYLLAKYAELREAGQGRTESLVRKEAVRTEVRSA